MVIWATGFRPAPLNFLDPIESRLEREGDEYKIDDNFAIQWDGPADRNIFVQNAAREQRGLADPQPEPQRLAQPADPRPAARRPHRSAAELLHRLDVQAVRR